ncbi:GNAT family protein [Haladaptatus sp. DJG-WS-42]|uniref:GNAT family N-acetyltransferase n=1 Tax=Haladaptatus sp. DJG-WS-42 TaxID=3120516 RepID=UPI0030D6121C
MSRTPYLQTERLELKPVTHDDEQFLNTHLNHPKIREHISSFRTPYSEMEQQDSFEEFHTGENVVSLVIWDGDERVGHIGLMPFHDRNKLGNLGYWIAPDHWGAGYATEAAEAIIGFGFDELGLHRIDAWIEAPNEGSRRVVEKLGFTHEGTKREAEFTGSEWVNQVLYGLLASEWKPGF